MVFAQNIVFFDGVCNLCNGLVNTLITLDKRQNLVFAPLQGTTFQTLVQERPNVQTSEAAPLSTIIFRASNGAIFTESDAAIRIIAALGGVFKIALIFLIIPRFLRNAAYRLVARHRYAWFGKRESCRVPTPELLTRFLP